MGDRGVLRVVPLSVTRDRYNEPTDADPQTGEVIERAPCGRAWGTALWLGGPILGGENWREFVRERANRSPVYREPKGRFDEY